jgi:NADPH:quinone reductase-like Zn-dependent oxidoreductase
MTAAYVTAPGPAESIVVGPLPTPEPGPGEVLVRTLAMAVNHVDTFIRSGAYATPMPVPFVIGRDLVGTVAALGPDVTEFAVGQRIWCNSLGHHGRQGSFAEYAVAAADRLYPLPDGADPVDAVSVLHPAATAWLGLFAHAGLAAGQTVAIGGAAGGVGSAAVQLASRAGARVIATANPRDEQWCRDCGAAEVIDYRSDVFAAIGSAAPGGLDLFWDTSGHHDLERTVPLLARGGCIVVAAGLRTRPVLPVGPLYTSDASIVGFAITNASVAELAAAAEAINELLGTGALRSRIARILPLREAATAHRLQEDPAAHPPGRIVVQA